MASILELDVGNSFIKWRLLEPVGAGVKGRVSELAELESILDENLQFVRISSVADEAREKALVTLLDSKSLKHQFARPQKAFAGIKSAYAEPEKMGADRWLAMIAAYHEVAGCCVVIDAGSALTIDVVDADGVHIGGYIIPGARMMTSALQGDTGKVRIEGEELLGFAPGKSTEECVHHGKWLALMGAIEFVVGQCRELWPQGFEVCITGGDGPALMAMMAERAQGWRLRVDLVMDGLAMALPCGDGG